MRVRYLVNSSTFCCSFRKDALRQIFQGVGMTYRILNLLEKRKQQLGLHCHTKKINCKRMIKTVLDNFFYQIKTLSRKKPISCRMSQYGLSEETSFSALV